MAVETVDNSAPQATVKRWLDEIDLASKEEEEYRKEAEKLHKRYRSEDNLPFNLLWSNVETLKPTVYSSTPRPDVRRRFADRTPIARQASMILERIISYVIDTSYFDDSIRNVRDESLITGRGVPWVVYKPTIVEVGQPEQLDPMTGEVLMPAQTVEVLADQHVYVEYVPYNDFRISPAKCWSEVRWVARKHKPNREQGLEQFGSIFANVPLNESLTPDNDNEERDYFKRACVWEIWDRDSGKRIWIAEGFKQSVLDEEDDPYGLDNFFPCPKPLYAFTVPGTMIPRAEYEVYRAQAAVVNETSEKINDLVAELKVAGVYPSVMASFDKLAKASNGELIGETMSIGNNMPNIQNMVAWWPFEKVAQVLLSLYEARRQAIQTIYEITGLSDIVRGATSAAETATAQQIKGNFSTMRMVPRQQPMQEMIRDIFRIMAELIAENFTQQNLQQMSGLQVTPEVVALLRNDKMRGFQVDVETDTTVAADAEREKSTRIEFLQALTQLVSQLAPATQQGMIPPEVAKALLGFGVRGFKVGRELEDAIDSISDGAQQQQQKQPSPQEMAQQLDLQIKQAELQMKQADLQAKHAEAREKIKIEQQKVDIDAAEAASDAQIEREKLQLEAAKAGERAAIDADRVNLETIRSLANDIPI